MKRFLKILKWSGLIIVFIIAGLLATIFLRQNLTYDAPYPEIHASTDTNIIQRGKEIVFGAAHCADCHFSGNADSLLRLGQEVSLSGGHVFDLPVGKIYSKNITPDMETGIGKFSDNEIARALRYGVHPDGTVVFDFMPFHNMADEDLAAVISYIRSQKAVRKPVPQNDLNLLGKVIKAFMIKPVGPNGPVEKSVKRDTTAAYGRYLAYNVANCNGCHTKRDLKGEFTGKPFAGGSRFDENGMVLYPPNLTPGPEGRITNWSEEQFIKRFRMQKQIPQSVMPWDSFRRMSDDDLKAIYKFLRTLKPEKTTPPEE